MNDRALELVMGTWIEKLSKSGNGNSTRDTLGNTLLHRLGRRRDGMFSDTYLHELYAPLTSVEIVELQVLIGKRLPSEVAKYYGIANGFSLYCGSLSFSGLRKQRDRTIRTPVSLEFGNSIEVPILDVESSSRLRLGFYAFGSGYEILVGNDGSGRVYLVPRLSALPVLKTWPCLAEFVQDELLRLEDLYGSCPESVDPLNPLPPPVLG